jgi:hypothetical protein
VSIFEECMAATRWNIHGGRWNIHGGVCSEYGRTLLISKIYSF